MTQDFLKPEDELYVNWKFDFYTETYATYSDFIVPVLFLHVFKDNVGYQLPITSDILITNNIETRNEYILSTINALKNNQKNRETLIDKNLN